MNYIWTQKAEDRAKKSVEYGARMNQIKAGEVATFGGEPIDDEIAEVWLWRGLIVKEGDG